MTPEEVIDFFAPHQSSVDSVVDWLASSGIAKDRVGHSANKQACPFPGISSRDVLTDCPSSGSSSMPR